MERRAQPPDRRHRHGGTRGQGQQGPRSRLSSSCSLRRVCQRDA